MRGKVSKEELELLKRRIQVAKAERIDVSPLQLQFDELTKAIGRIGRRIRGARPLKSRRMLDPRRSPSCCAPNPVGDPSPRLRRNWDRMGFGGPMPHCLTIGLIFEPFPSGERAQSPA